MADLNFPVNPTLDQTFVANNVIYIWNGEYWEANNSKGYNDTFVQLAGDTMTGQLTLPGGGGATQALQKQEIETLVAAGGGGGGGGPTTPGVRYQEGNWTPATANGTLSFTESYTRWTRTGNKITLWSDLSSFSSTSGSVIGENDAQ